MKRENKPYKLIEYNRIAVIIAVIILMLIFIIILSTTSINALTAKIGNGKVVLNAKVGDIIEKSVKVINSNNVSVFIELIGGGDLQDQFIFKKNNFTLAPNEETDAGYSLRVTKKGRSDSQINVKFMPLEGKNGIVLPATVIIFAAGGNNTTGSWTNWFSGSDNNLNKTRDNSDPSIDKRLNPLAVGLFITAIIFIILLVVLSIYLKNKRRVKLNHKKRK